MSITNIKPTKSTTGNIVTTYRAERTYNDYKPGDLKSALQKYIRRKEADKARYCLIDLDLFSLVEESDKSTGKQIKDAKRMRTNMVNRLIAIMSEDIGICNPYLPIKMWSAYDKWRSHRDNTSGRKHLMNMLDLLMVHKRLRLISNYKSVYNLAPYYIEDKSFEKLDALHKKLLKDGGHNHEYDMMYGRNHEKLNEVTKANIMKHLKNDDESVFCIIHNIYRNKDTKMIATVITIIKSLLAKDMKYTNITKSVEALHNFYRLMTHKEKPIYFYQIVLLYLNRDKISSTNYANIDTITTSAQKIKKYYNKNLNNEKIKLDDYVFDIHTHTSTKTPLTNFAKTGANVVDEDTDYLNKDYKKIYDEYKELLDKYNNDNLTLDLPEKKDTKDTPNKEEKSKDIKDDKSKDEAESKEEKSEKQKPKQKSKPKSFVKGGKHDPDMAHKKAIESDNEDDENIDEQLVIVYKPNPVKKSVKKSARIYNGVSMIDIPIESENKIKSKSQAQKLTAKFKKACYLYGDYVVKGPYNSLDKIDINIENTKKFMELETKLNLPRYLKTVMQYEIYQVMSSHKDDSKKKPLRWYLKADNMGDISTMKTEKVTTKLETDVEVVERGSVVNRICELEKTPGILTDKIKTAVLQHLYIRYLLNIGDSGTHNILLVKDTNLWDGMLVLGNDMEEKTTYGLRDSKLGCLFRKSSKIIEKVYDTSILKKIRTFKKERDEFDSEINNRITHFNSLIS